MNYQTILIDKASMHYVQYVVGLKRSRNKWSIWYADTAIIKYATRNGCKDIRQSVLNATSLENFDCYYYLYNSSSCHNSCIGGYYTDYSLQLPS